LIEHYAGHLPLWLSPVQIVICTITQEADDYAYEVATAARKLGLNVNVDARNEKITYKVREHSHAKVPVLLVAGKKEAAERTISMRRLGSQQQTQLGIEEALAQLAAEATPPDLRG
jgi:threonyl-tRNA synthetase